jgi:hypothetical protein
MDIEIQIRVTAELCCETVRNAAYYKSGWTSPRDLKRNNQDFWVNLNGNFLDIAVLSWCFNFGDKKAEFKWQNLFDDEETFEQGMYSHLKCTKEEFEDYILSMRTYRDKCVAHRDRYLSESSKIKYPDLIMAIESSCFLFNELRSTYKEMNDLFSIKDLNKFYKQRLKHGKVQYHA